MIRLRTRGRVAAACLCGALVACAPSGDPGESAVAARVGDSTITVAQVDARVREADPDAWQALYEARRRALDYLVDEALLEAEAARHGIDRDSLVNREVTGTLTAVSDSSVAAFYEENRQRMGAQNLDDVREPIRRYLAADAHRQAWGSFLTGLRDAAAVDIALEPPRATLEIGPGERVKGPADAPIVIVEYSDFECPYCARAQGAVQQVLEAYGDDVRLVYRDFPLRMHEHAPLAAQAARCAHEQGRFWDYHDELFRNHRELTPADLRRHAASVGLDAGAFDACLDSGRHAAAVDLDMASGERLGVSGTPAFFINGRLLSGAQPLAAFAQIIDEELRRAGR